MLQKSLIEQLIKRIKKRIRKKERFLKIKNVKFKNYLKIIKITKEKTYIKKKKIKKKKNVIIKNVFAITNSNLRVIKYQKIKSRKKQKTSTNYIQQTKRSKRIL